MDCPESLDTAAKEWLWLFEWTEAKRSGQDWAAVIKCLQDVAQAEVGDSCKDDDCVAWADLIEALAGYRPAELVAGVPAGPRVAKAPMECR